MEPQIFSRFGDKFVVVVKGLKPMEYKKVDLGVKIILPKHYCALLMNKSSARVKYGVHVFLGLIDVGYHNFLQTVIQNVSGREITLPAGIAVAQLLVFESRIPKFELGWDELESRNGSFGSTGNDFEKLNPATDLATNMIQLEKYQTFFKGAIDILNPYSFKIDNMNINLLGNLEDRTEKITELLDLERKSFSPCNTILEKLPYIDCLSVDFLNNEPLGDDKIPPLSESEKAAL